VARLYCRVHAKHYVTRLPGCQGLFCIYLWTICGHFVDNENGVNDPRENVGTSRLLAICGQCGQFDYWPYRKI